MFAVSEHRADFCKIPNCQYYLLNQNESIDLASPNLDMNGAFSYQSVDCLFKTFKYYFPCIKNIQGFMFQKLLSAIDFKRSLRFPVLTNLSFTKKRLLRKKFRKNGTSAKSATSFSNRSNSRFISEKKFNSEFRNAPTVPANCF